MKVTIERPKNGVNLNKLISPREPKFWAGLEKAAQDAGDTKGIEIIRDSHAQATRLPTGQMGAAVAQDALIPAELTIGYRPQLTLAQSSRTADYNADLDSFGADRTIDYRAKTGRRFELSVMGEVNRYLFGNDPTTVSADLKPYDTKRGWYQIGISRSWQDEMDEQYAGIFNWLAVMMSYCVTAMHQARCQVAFEGDPVYQLRGVKQLPVERISLPKTFDKMTYLEHYNWMTALTQRSNVVQGEVGIRKTHMLHPCGYDALLMQLNPDGNYNTKLGELLYNGTSLKRKSTDYMAKAGVNGEPAALLYNRNSEHFIRDLPLDPIVLAPEYSNGTVNFTFVMKIGELSVTNPYAGLLVSNFLTKPM